MTRHHVQDDLEAVRAFEDLYLQTYRKTLAYASRRTCQPADAHDVVAETYAVAWRRVDEFTRANAPQAWLYRVAYLTLTNERRSNKRRSSLIERIEADVRTAQSIPNPIEAVRARDELTRTIAAMRSLNARDQEVLFLAAFENLNHGEIAQVLGIQKTIVRSVLHRARKRLSLLIEMESERQGVPPGHKDVEADHVDGDTAHG